MADELTAQKKFTCAFCGGEARWDPAKQALVCAYCGSVAPGKEDAATGEIHEHDLIAALRNVPDDQRGWATATRSVRCQSCQAISVFEPDRVAQRCAFCGSSALVNYEELRAPIRPESLLAFKIGESQVRDAARQWYGTRWFAPNKLKKAALTDKLHGFYLPFWTFDAQAHCPWTAEAGYHYYVTEEYTDANGKRQTRQVQRTRWEPASGRVEHFFDDKLVTASKGVPSDLIADIEPFPTTGELTPYEPSYLSGWVVEHYQIDLPAAAERSKKLMAEDLREMCAAQVPGDTHRSLSIYPEYSAETYKHVLLPVWVLSYNYFGTAYQMLVNGYTGKIAGRYPKSWVKITLLVLFIIIAVLIIMMMASGGQH
jgi:hypothetical protein